jgi:hypothetical protein
MGLAKSSMSLSAWILPAFISADGHEWILLSCPSVSAKTYSNWSLDSPVLDSDLPHRDWRYLVKRAT